MPSHDGALGSAAPDDALHECEEVRARYLSFAENESKGYSPRYEHLARVVASDDDVVDFISRMPVIQPNLFFAAVQFLTGPDDMPRDVDTLSAFVQSHREDVEQLMRARRTQTNEVGRCASLLPALPEGRLALLEMGASAGLCLGLDNYSYDYGDVRVGDDGSSVRLVCAVSGAPPIPDALPEIVWRAGLDLAPVDLTNDDDVRWILSCVWPDHPERRKRLAAAVEVRRGSGLIVRRGDIRTGLSALIDEAPPGVQLVVFNSAVLCYLDAEGRSRVAATLAEASRTRDIVWITNEAPGVIPEITALTSSGDPLHFLLGRTRFSGGRRTDELLAIAHAHGATLEWLHSGAAKS